MPIRYSAGRNVAINTSAAIRILRTGSGGGCRATTGSNLLPVADTTYSRSVAPPIPPNGRNRTKAPAECWGFRLSLSPEILAGARRSAPPGFEMMALNVLG